MAVYCILKYFLKNAYIIINVKYSLHLQACNKGVSLLIFLELTSAPNYINIGILVRASELDAQARGVFPSLSLKSTGNPFYKIFNAASGQSLVRVLFLFPLIFFPSRPPCGPQPNSKKLG